MTYRSKNRRIVLSGLVLAGLLPLVSLAATLEERLVMAGYTPRQIQRIVNGETTLRELQAELRLSMAGYTAAEITRMRNARKMAAARPEPLPPPPKPSTATAWQRSQRYHPIVNLAASHYRVAKPLILAVMQAESDFDPRAVSPKGAMGLMQLMPETARQMGVTQPFNPYQNIMAGTHFLALCLERFADLQTALAAYNAGPENARQNHLNASVKAYIERVLRFQVRFQEDFRARNLPI